MSIKEKIECHPVLRHLKPKKYIIYIFLFIYAIIALFPLYFAVISSFKGNMEIFLNPFTLPKQWGFENYTRALEVGNMAKSFINSIILTVSVLIITGSVGALASFVIARFSFKLQNLTLIFFISGMMIPVQAVIIPLSFTFGKLGIINNYPILILLFTAFQIPITILIITGFMRSIPCEIEEAAVMDGCKPFRIFLSIIIPMSMPAISTASIFNFLNVWNNLLFPLIFINKKDLQVISLALQSFFAERTSDFGGVMAAIVISILPPLISYILLQEKVERGMTAGAVKG